eukprot:SAG31_NODE_469_length_15244_cov_11.537141_18_plen_177_part_00
MNFCTTAPQLRKTLKFEIDAANAATAARAEAVKQTAAAAAAVRREEQLQVTRATVQQAAVSGLIGRVEAFMKEMSHKAAKEEAEYNRRLEELAVTQSPAAKMAAQTVKENDAQYTEVSASKWTIGQSVRKILPLLQPDCCRHRRSTFMIVSFRTLTSLGASADGADTPTVAATSSH